MEGQNAPGTARAVAQRRIGPNDAAQAAEHTKALALDLGFDLVGIAAAQPGPWSSRAFRAWVEAGMQGEMGYMGRPDRVQRTLRPGGPPARAESVVVVGKNYFTGDLPHAVRDDPSRGLIASYAWRRDYHDTLKPRLERLADAIASDLGAGEAPWATVDTGPLLERDAAERAGLGFVGKNTMLIHPEWGAWLFLGAILVRTPLPPDDPMAGTCGQCTRCLVACPTDAFPRPYVLDSRRCISYLTIELRGPIPRDLRRGIGNRIFGCDICNEVCPYNRQKARVTSDPDLVPNPDWVAPPLLDLIRLDSEAFRERFAGSPITRAKRRGFLRNVCVALGNWGSAQAREGLIGAMADSEPLVRGHAAWGLGEIGDRAAKAALEASATRETDDYVRGEIAAALGTSGT